ncbi:MAG: 16S rRNA (cytidine(1402)-2'-O)-methyltransferase [Chloroflexi bacterium]|nr:16S rRNA (cytidine(1402)-2'-O)-methyltransferase [Chloroflexota bacterium]
MGILYVVATPIGNLEDITMRAVRILKNVLLIAAEDTRHAQILKKHFNLSAPFTSYYEHNKAIKANVVLKALQQGDVALISDAGTPAISDPGVDIVRAAQQAGFKVSPVAGPSSLTAAISAAGIAAPHYLFLGFLPVKGKERRKIIEQLKNESAAAIIYEAPHRLSKTLAELAETLGNDREIAVARELTKLYEEIWRGNLQEAVAWSYGKKGEIVLILAPSAIDKKDRAQSLADTQKILKELKEQGFGAKEATAMAVIQTKQSKKMLYQLFLQL